MLASLQWEMAIYQDINNSVPISYLIRVTLWGVVVWVCVGMCVCLYESMLSPTQASNQYITN